MLTASVARGEPPSRERTAGVMLIGAGALGVFFGLAFTARSANLKDDVRAACAAGCDWSSPAIRNEDAAGHRANTMAEIGLVGGGAAVIGGLMLYVLGRPAPVTLAPARSGAVVTARLTF